jgi:putative transposase
LGRGPHLRENAFGLGLRGLYIDVFSRAIVGWQIPTSLRSDLAIDALEMAIYARNGQDLSHLVHHSERGVQNLRIRNSERLGEADIIASVGSKGDSYDNPLAKSFNGPYKTELIHRKGPWRNVEHVEWETLKYVEWFNNRRIHELLGHVPPVEFEAHYYDSKSQTAWPFWLRFSLQLSRRDSECELGT